MPNLRQAEIFPLGEYAAFSLEASYQGLGISMPRTLLAIFGVNMPAAGMYYTMGTGDNLRIRANSELMLDLGANGAEFRSYFGMDAKTDDSTDSNTGNFWITSIAEVL